jgi:hypothetical protein
MRISVWKLSGLAIWSVFGLLAGRCNYEVLSPPLTSLRVEPDVVCPGTQVCVIWDGPATSTVGLTATPPDAVAPALDPAARHATPGRFCFTPSANLTLRVSHYASGADLPHNVDFPVQVVPAGGTVIRIAAAGECVSGRPSWPPVVMEAGPGVNACQVTAEGATTQVSHAGVTAALPAGSTSSAFAGTALDGEWRLTPTIVLSPGTPAPCTGPAPDPTVPSPDPGAPGVPEASIQVVARCGGC